MEVRGATWKDYSATWNVWYTGESWNYRVKVGQISVRPNNGARFSVFTLVRTGTGTVRVRVRVQHATGSMHEIIIFSSSSAG